MEKHLRAVGILNIALGALGVLAALLTLVLFKGPSGILLINARIGGSATTQEGFVTACILIYFLLMAGPLIALGFGLLRYQEWARNMGVIVSIFSLVNIPVGTVIGIYSIWVLTSFEVEPLFRNPPVPPAW